MVVLKTASGSRVVRHRRGSVIRRRLGAVFHYGGVLAACASIAVGSLVVLRDAGVSSGQPPQVGAPSLQALNRSIALAERYLDGLYKPLPDGTAVQSEAYGLPLHARFGDHWSLLGTDEASISGGVSNPDAESYRVFFGPAGKPGIFEAEVKVNWRVAPGRFAVTVTPKRVGRHVELWLDENWLGTFSSDYDVPATRSFSTADQSSLRMLRYTVRHANQEAYLYWLARGGYDKADRLAKFLDLNNYTPGFDIRAAIFGQSGNLPDDLPFNPRAYLDCDHLPAVNPMAYAYASKVCLSISVYNSSGQTDTFLQLTLALHMLQKYNPDYRYNSSVLGAFWTGGSSPRDTARLVQAQWARTGYGVPTCNPFQCIKAASGIRTSAFGTLEAELGYHHGDLKAQAYADAAAAMIVTAQVKEDGLVRMASGNIFRPAHVGGFLVAWDDATGRFAPPSDGPAVGILVAGVKRTPDEYRGVVPSNSETSFDAWAFLVRYRCVKYHVCS